MPFKKLKLIEPLLRAIASEGYNIPTAIQTNAIPRVLEGRDLFGCAQTGTGKTAAFALPILQQLHRHTVDANPDGSKSRRNRPARALVITPTRELAAQIDDSFGVYGQHTGLRSTAIFGGVSQFHQVKRLRKGIDILVATPGRLLDLMNQGVISLHAIEILVLDEADRMLDMGFLPDIRQIVNDVPQERQTLMFSATMPKKIRAMSRQFLTKPVEVRIPTESPAVDTVHQVLYHIDQKSKMDLLGRLLKNEKMTKALVFTRTKHAADRVAQRLQKSGITCDAIHSNKSQNTRTRTLGNFKSGKTRVLVASDIASRGLDIDDITHVVNFDLPHEPETYVHRIGRTGRAGANGQAISFCTGQQRGHLRDIERLLGRSIPVLQHRIKPPPAPEEKTPQPKRPRRHTRGKSPAKASGTPQKPNNRQRRPRKGNQQSSKQSRQG